MAVSELQPGTKLGPQVDGGFRYDVVSTLGAGGFGITYLARDGRLDADVVIKELACDSAAFRDTASGIVHPARGRESLHARLTEKFLREAQLLNRLRSPHIVRVIDVWEERGTAYYAMDRLDATAHLSARAATTTPAAWGTWEKWLLQLLDALGTVHEAGMIHGDVKPENVLIDKRAGAVLIDFGTARTDTDLSRTATSMAYSVGYAPPELTHPARLREAGPWSDLYSFGMMAWGLAIPHRGESERPHDAWVREHSGDPYADGARDLRQAGVPGAWADAIAACIALDPSARPQSVADLLDVVNPTPAEEADTAPHATAPLQVAGAASAPSGTQEAIPTWKGAAVVAPPAPMPATPAGSRMLWLLLPIVTAVALVLAWLVAEQLGLFSGR